MSRKIELNVPIDMVREVVKQPHTQPIVTVAVRADGSVEKVTFEVSSGVPALDDAIRKVIASQAPYGAFSPSLARRYDVIEIRRTWVFDYAIRLQ
jgi:outer membrane biosynthesis protein TonB